VTGTGSIEFAASIGKGRAFGHVRSPDAREEEAREEN
jgi:hypothetical protein